MVHLLMPILVNNLRPLGQYVENNPNRGVLVSDGSKPSVSSFSESTSSVCSDLISVMELSLLSAASAISPGFLSKSPLNCLRAFFSAS